MMTRTKAMLAAIGGSLPLIFAAAGPAKAFVVFAPAALAAALGGSVLFGGLVGNEVAANHYASAEPAPASVYVTRPGETGCHPATVRVHHQLHHVQVCD
jgi:hypothetical protein